MSSLSHSLAKFPAPGGPLSLSRPLAHTAALLHNMLTSLHVFTLPHFFQAYAHTQHAARLLSMFSLHGSSACCCLKGMGTWAAVQLPSALCCIT